VCGAAGRRWSRRFPQLRPFGIRRDVASQHLTRRRTKAPPFAADRRTTSTSTNWVGAAAAALTPEPVGTSRAATGTALLHSRRDVGRTPSRSTHCALGGQRLPRTGRQSRTAYRPRTAIDLGHAARIALPRRRSIGCLNERRTHTDDRSLREDRDEPRADAVPNHGILRRRRSGRRLLLHRCCLGLEWRAESPRRPNRTGLRPRMQFSRGVSHRLPHAEPDAVGHALVDVQLVPDEGRRKARLDLRLDRRSVEQRPSGASPSRLRREP
jgi:hypothetical protein